MRERVSVEERFGLEVGDEVEAEAAGGVALQVGFEAEARAALGGDGLGERSRDGVGDGLVEV